MINVFKDPTPPKPDQFVELKSPYVGVKSASSPLAPLQNRSTSSRFARTRSRTQLSLDEGIQELDEKAANVDQMMPHCESPTDLNKIKLEITHVDVYKRLIKA